MNEYTAFVKEWLVSGETIISVVDELLYFLKSSYPVSSFQVDHGTPAHRGILVLTSRRLILIDTAQPVPRWYSVTGIASLSERPPKYKRDRLGHDYPYQAVVSLCDGVMLVLETSKDNVEQRGRDLSGLLVTAQIQLGCGQPLGHVFRAYAEQYEGEKRRRDND